MRGLLRFSLVLALGSAVLAPAAAGSAPACAAEASHAPHAALVVGTGGSTTTYCVALDASTVTGIHLVQLAGSQFGLQYRLGFGGQAVCQLAGVGPSGGDCFADYPDFWGYWHGDRRGGWSWAGSGAASASIGSGDMDGWVWGSGDSATTHAAPPALAFDEVCTDPAPSPTPTPPPGGGGGGGGGSGRGEGGGGDGGGEATTSGPEVEGNASSEGRPHQHDDGEDERSGSPAVSATSSITPATPLTEEAAGITDDPTDAGPPVGALLALAGIVALGAGGWFLRRRRPEGRDG